MIISGGLGSSLITQGFGSLTFGEIANVCGPLLFLTTPYGVVKIYTPGALKIPTHAVPTTEGVITAVDFGTYATPTIINLFPADKAIAQTSAITFLIGGAAYLQTSEIMVTINGVDAISAGNFVNSYTGTLEYNSVLCAYSVSITPPEAFPTFVGYTITLDADPYDPYGYTFAYTFRTTSQTTSGMFVTSQNVRKLYATDIFVLAVTDSGLDIIDKRTMTNYAFVWFSGGFTSVWSMIQHIDTDCVYLGTDTSGIYKIALSDIVRGGDVTQYCQSKFTAFTALSLSSNQIIDLHGYGNNLAVLMPNNVNIIKDEVTKYSSGVTSTISSGSVWVSSLYDVYYTGTNGLNAKYRAISDWSSPDYVYNTTSTPALGSNIINDLYVASATNDPTNNFYDFNNSLFIATANGLFVIQEKKGSEAISSIVSYGNAGKDHNILDSDVCTLVWVDKIHAYKSGHIFVADSTGKLYFIDVNTNLAEYTYTIATGNFGELLNSSSLHSIVSL